MRTLVLQPGSGQRRATIAGAVAVLAITLGSAAARVDWPQWLDQGAAETAIEEEPISLAQQQELIALTENDAPETIVEGQEALVANAAIPFARLPIIPARPFSIAGAAAGDQERALQCMTQAVYYEAGYEPIEGKRAVAQVVLNRLRHPAFPNSVCGVVYEGSHKRVCQFSFTCDGSLARQPSPRAWAEARKVARDALNGLVQSTVGTATHYHADYVSPYWAPRLTKLIKHGAHIFYRWPGSWGLPSAFGGRYAGMEAIPSFALAEPETQLAFDENLPPVARLPERRAENDVGGRIDPSKGWTPKIPMPSETRSAYASIATQQTGVSEVKTEATPVKPLAGG